ncbi:MAG: 6-phospho-3-hexuloisomerase [Anaerolineae bacterium]
MTSALETLIPSLLKELEGALRSVNPTTVDALRQAIIAAPRIFVTGRGRSGLHMRGFAMRLMHIGRAVYVVDETTTPGIGEGDLLLIGSGSGRTASQVGHATKAKSLNAKVGLITIAETSPMAEIADFVVRINAVTPKLEGSAASGSFQPMGTLFEQSLGLLLDLMVVQLMDDLQVTADQMFTRHANLE